MKRPALLLIVLALLLAAGALAPVFKSDPGLVQIHFLDYIVETSVLVLIITLALAWLLVSWLVRLWRLPAETARRVQQRRSLKQLEKGLLALTEGDWRAAEIALEKSTGDRGGSTARYLAAAQAADGQQAEERREYYLEQADSGGRRKHFLVELTRARMLVTSGAWASAVPVLEALRQRRRRHQEVLKLLVSCRESLGHWAELNDLLPDLRKSGTLDDEAFSILQTRIATNMLRAADSAERLEAVWSELSKPMRNETAVIAVYAEAAGVMGRADLAERVLRASLKRQWNSDLVLRYGDPGAENVSLRLKQCEKWMTQHDDDANLHLALGRLCVGESLWGKARQHLIRSLELRPSSIGYEALGQLVERQGELELAMECFRNALRLNQGKDPLPLTADPVRLAPPSS